MDRIGRNNRLLGKRGSDLDRLDENAKKRLLDISGICEDDIDGAEKEELLEVLLKSNPQFLKNFTPAVDPPEDTVIVNTKASSDEQSVDTDCDINFITSNDDEATQPPEQVIIESDDEDDERMGDVLPEESHQINLDYASKQSAHKPTKKEEQRNHVLPKVEEVENVKEINSRDQLKPRRPSSNLSSQTNVPCDSLNSPNTVTGCVSDEQEDKDEEEETQAYDVQHTLVEETQRIISDKISTIEPSIPESQSSGQEDDDNECNTSPQSLSEKSTITGTLHWQENKKFNPWLILRTYRPSFKLAMSSTKIDTNLCREGHTAIVALLLSQYLRRLQRQQSRIEEKIPWGKPVQMGEHVGGCLRGKGRIGARRNADKEEDYPARSNNGKGRDLRRKVDNTCKKENFDGNSHVANNDDDWNDFDIPRNSENKSKTSIVVEPYNENLIHMSSTRKSARKCLSKIAADAAEPICLSDSNDHSSDDWMPGKLRAKGKKGSQTSKNMSLKSAHQKNESAFLSLKHKTKQNVSTLKTKLTKKGIESKKQNHTNEDTKSQIKDSSSKKENNSADKTMDHATMGTGDVGESKVSKPLKKPRNQIIADEGSSTSSFVYRFESNSSEDEQQGLSSSKVISAGRKRLLNTDTHKKYTINNNVPDCPESRLKRQKTLGNSLPVSANASCSNQQRQARPRTSGNSKKISENKEDDLRTAFVRNDSDTDNDDRASTPEIIESLRVEEEEDAQKTTRTQALPFSSQSTLELPVDHEGLENVLSHQSKRTCPICNQQFPLIDLEAHASTCGEEDLQPEPVNPPDFLCPKCKMNLPRTAMREHQRTCLGPVAPSVRNLRLYRGEQN